MLTFLQYLIEYPIGDIRWFKELDDVKPPKKVADVESLYDMDDEMEWKDLEAKQFTTSRELGDGVVAMVPGDTTENWMHELGHQFYDDLTAKEKEEVQPILDYIKTKHDYKEKGSHVKQIEINDYYYTYSHSGKQYENDEVFAIMFAVHHMTGLKDKKLEKMAADFFADHEKKSTSK